AEHARLGDADPSVRHTLQRGSAALDQWLLELDAEHAPRRPRQAGEDRGAPARPAPHVEHAVARSDVQEPEHRQERGRLRTRGPVADPERCVPPGQGAHAARQEVGSRRVSHRLADHIRTAVATTRHGTSVAQMSNAIELIPEASRVVTDLPLDGEWDRPTPCTEWSVRDLLNHLTAEHLWVPHLLRGETLEQVGSRYDGDVLGDDPMGSWRRAITASVLAWGQADADGRVHTSMGLMPTGEYANQMLVDLTVHAWDLARAVGVRPHLVPDAVEAALVYEKPRVGAGEVPGIFAAPLQTDSESRVDQLVALLGRDPGWAPPA